jgi:hypothetical protein
VVADGGTFEAFACMKHVLRSIGKTVIDNAKLILTPNGYKAGKLYAVKPFDGTGDFDVVRATTAWRRNSSGIWESVATNVPRLHYPVGGGCPSVLVEPQRTNLFLRSQEFDNASWGKSQTTITANSIVSPDGISNADTHNSLTTGSTFISQSVSTISSTRYNVSVFAKKGLNDYFAIVCFDGGNISRVYFDLVNGVNSNINNSGTPNVEDILVTDEGNGWFRCSFSQLVAGTSFQSRFYASNDGINLTAGVIGATHYIWQAQVEEGTEATSIIPTTSATVTRNEDVIDVTTPSGVTEIVETFSDGSTNTETIIPATYQIPQGEIKSIVMT